MNASPSLSIVVAAVNASETLDAWLCAIAPQIESRDVEVLIAGADDCTAVPTMDVQLIAVPRGVLVPSMWSAGITRARGSIIAVTISACLPDREWVDAILAAHALPHAAIGGVIDHAADGSLVDRAVHLVRYTPYLPPLAAGPVVEVAGDNGTYKRASIEAFLPAIARDGFWEAEINRQLRTRGETLWIEPRIRVSHARSYSAAAFCRQRFIHGRVFGRTRHLPLAGRLARAAFSPFVPALMLARSVRTVSARGRLDGRAILAIPLALWFLICWAAGEAVGLLGG